MADHGAVATLSAAALRDPADAQVQLALGRVYLEKAERTMDRRSVSFMYSFPNYIPLNAKSVQGIARAVAPLAFDRIYGAWWSKNIEADAKAAFDASVRRYLMAISAEPNEPNS